MDTGSSETIRRRRRLRVAAKLMAYLGFAGIVYVFISAIRSGSGEVPDLPSMQIDLTGIEPGQLEFHDWENRPVLVYRRLDEDIVALRTGDPRLLDPDSERSEQPDQYTNAFRSASPDWFVAIALGTGQGCLIARQSADDTLFLGQPWTGGFRDSCSDDRYDTAGRVYDQQYAKRNLVVPRYTIEANTLILGR